MPYTTAANKIDAEISNFSIRLILLTTEFFTEAVELFSI